jgi:DNA mismatch repair protein MutL
MGRIRVLEADVADQIAAGEVVERPASVVKELVENALDAGAGRVDVELATGDEGMQRITVVDDGCGMGPDDAVVCFSRHATSKLRQAEDLRRIGTFGFRGEALAAIASIARIRLLTREPERPSGTEVRVDAGRVTSNGEAGAPVGTRIDVHDLFFNVPARRKFLKAGRTEVAHVEDALCSSALSAREVAFSLTVDGKRSLDLPASPEGALLDHPACVERAVRCLGKQVRPLLYPFDRQTDLLRLVGYVVAPLETRRDLSGVHLAVNGRPVSDRGLTQAVRQAFRTLLEVGRQPLLALDIRIEPDVVDVNVHPRKAEVRFADARRVSGHVISLLSDFLADTPWLKTRGSPTTGSGAGGSGAEGAPARVMFLKDGASTPPITPADVASVGVDPSEAHRARVQEALARYASHDRGMAPPSFGSPFGPPSGSSGRVAPSVEPRALMPEAGLGGAPRFSALRVVGQIGATYLVLEAPTGMVVIDQHAAHERVVFERLRAARTGPAPSQPLLLPLQLELSAQEMAALEAGEGGDAARAVLDRHGLVIEPFGDRTALVKAVPPGLDAKKAKEIVRDALAELGRDGGTGALDDRVDRLCARLACHAAIRAGDVLSPESVRALLTDLDAIDLGAHCPHGRPVVRTVRYDELASWFDRR